MLVFVYVFRRHSKTRGFDNNLIDSLFKALSASPIILVAESQVAMTPDCFVCPLTPLRGALVNQALPVRGRLKGGNMAWHFLSKN